MLNNMDEQALVAVTFREVRENTKGFDNAVQVIDDLTSIIEYEKKEDKVNE